MKHMVQKHELKRIKWEKKFFFEMQHMWDELGQDMQLQWTEGNNYRK